MCGRAGVLRGFLFLDFEACRGGRISHIIYIIIITVIIFVVVFVSIIINIIVMKQFVHKRTQKNVFINISIFFCKSRYKLVSGDRE